MATNPYVNKVVYDGTTIIDISDTTATASDVLNSKYIYTASGQKVQGSIASKSSSDLTVNGATVTAPAGFYSSSASKTVASGTEGTPTATKGTVSNHSISVTPSVTNSAGYISGGTHSGTAVSVSASELVSGTYTVDSSGTKDVTNYASVSIPAADAAGIAYGSYVTQNGQRKWVLTHEIYGETAGWIPEGASGSSYSTYNAVASGTTVTPTTSSQTIGGANTMMEGAVTINPIPSQYIVPSGSQTITTNNTYDVTSLAQVVVNVSGGGGSSVQMDVVSASSYTSSTLTFTGMKGEPTSFSAMSIDSISTGTPSKIAAIVYDGTDIHTQTITNTSNAQVTYVNTGVSYTYNSGTLVITSTGAQFQSDAFYLVYSYGGSASNVHTEDVQVGSGATSITFTGLEDEPIAWYCIFKSNFSTSSGYQRVIFTRYDGDLLEGMSMDSGANVSDSSWTQTYNNGSLTITSSGTNNGGYFHQPGYYQLTYMIGEASPYEKVSKTYRASTTAQSEKIEPSTGYDAMSEVNVTIPAVTQTNLTAANIKSGTTVTISNGSTNLWSVTGTYSGGGGSANIATATMTNSSNQNTSIAFTLPSGRTPKAFFARLTSQIARNSNSRYYYVFDMRWDGSSTGGVAGNTFYMYNGTLTNVTSGYSYSQSGTTFTLSSTGSRSASPGSFYNGDYELVYIY